MNFFACLSYAKGLPIIPIMGRILIVDDSNMMRALVRRSLTAVGHEIAGEAVNGLEAIRKYSELHPDLVTMDVTMSEKDGLSASNEILKKYPDAIIVMVTAIGQEALIRTAVKMGVKDFVVKPFEEARLQAAVNRALAH